MSFIAAYLMAGAYVAGLVHGLNKEWDFPFMFLTMLGALFGWPLALLLALYFKLTTRGEDEKEA